MVRFRVRLLCVLLTLLLAAASVPAGLSSPASAAAQAALPDLQVTDVGIVEPDYVLGDTVRFFVKFRNAGAVPLTAGWLGVTWFVDGAGYTWQGASNATVAPGQELMFTGRNTYKIDKPVFRLRVFVDDNRVIAEADESNNVLEVEINATPDQEAPSVPTSLRVLGTNRNALAFGWIASTDNKAVAGYDVYVNGVKHSTVAALDTIVEVRDLSPNTAYTVAVAAFDRAGNVSSVSEPLSATTTATRVPTTVYASYKLMPGAEPDGLRLQVFESTPPAHRGRMVLNARYDDPQVFTTFADGDTTYLHTSFKLEPGTYSVLLRKHGYEYKQEQITIPEAAYVDYTGGGIARYYADGVKYAYQLLAPDRRVSKEALITLSQGINHPVIWNEDRFSRYSKDDWTRIREAGFRNVRMFAAYEYLFDPKQPSVPKQAYVDRVNKVVQEALDAGLGVTVGVRDVPPEIWTDKTYRTAEDFAAFWRAWATILQNQFQHVPNYRSRIFLEICNEPWAETPAEWNLVQKRVMLAMREGAPEMTLIAAGNMRVNASTWHGVNAFVGLTPVQDDNIIYNFHQYDPYVFTHQEVIWHGWIVLKETRDLPYPVNANDDPMKYIAPAPNKPAGSQPDPRSIQEITKYVRTGWNKQKLRELLQPAVDWQERYRKPIIINEFGNNYSNGALGGIPMAYAHTFNHDSRELFEELGWGWALWSFTAIQSPDQPGGMNNDTLEALGLHPATSPQTPRRVEIVSETSDSLTIQWEAVSDTTINYVTGEAAQVPAYAYDVYVDGTMVGFASGDATSYTITGIDTSKRHEIRIQARDSIGNTSRFSPPIRN
jgi:endoglucanase